MIATELATGRWTSGPRLLRRLMFLKVIAISWMQLSSYGHTGVSEDYSTLAVIWLSPHSVEHSVEHSLGGGNLATHVEMLFHVGKLNDHLRRWNMFNGKRGMDYYYGSPTIIRDCKIIIIHSDPLPPNTDPLIIPHNSLTIPQQTWSIATNDTGFLQGTCGWSSLFLLGSLVDLSWDLVETEISQLRCVGAKRVNSRKAADCMVNPKNSGHFDSHSSAEPNMG